MVRINLKKTLIGILLGCMLAVFLNPNLSLFLGPVIAAGFVWLYFGGYKEFVVAAILVANDALGTIIAGSLSFQYLLLGLVFLDIVMKKSWRYSVLAFLMVACVLLGELLAVAFINMRQVLFSAAYILGFVCLSWDEDSADAFFRSVAVIVCVIAIHTCITGGVEFYQHDSTSTDFERKGILGVGIGDANYSGYLLNIGLVCLWCDKKAKLWIKCLASLPVLYAMSVTLSTSTLMSLLLIILLGLYLGRKKSKALSRILVVCLVLIVAFQLYTNLPKEMRLEQIDAYIMRMEEKLNAYKVGDMSTATTGRSDISAQYWQYIFSQPVLKMLFGGNSLDIISSKHVPHNTYIGLMLQIGLLGTLCFLYGIGVRFLKSFLKIKENPNAKRLVLLKVLSLFVAVNLSLYEGSLWAIWLGIVLLL